MTTKIAKVAKKTQSAQFSKGPTVTKTKTQIKWTPNRQKVDLSLIDNPLAKPKHKLVNKKVTELTTEILADKKYKAQVEFYKTNNITFDAGLIPKFEMHKLLDLLTPEEVQRLLDHAHMTGILSKFDPRLLSPIYVVRLHGKPELFVFDSMHTLTSIAVLIQEGLMSRKNEKTGKYEVITDGLDFEYPCWVIDTDDESFPSVAALYRNGEGSKAWGPYDYHRVYVRSFDFYNNPGPNGEYQLASQKQQLMVAENSCPLPKGHPDLGMIGTFGHIEAMTEYKHNDLAELEFIVKTNNKYWKGTNDASMFGFYGNLYQGFTNVNQPTSGKAFNAFLDELHAVIKTFFTSMAELKSATGAAYKDFQFKQNKTGTTPPFNCALSIVLKMYVRLGGKHPVTSDVNMFVYSPSSNVKIDIYDSLPLSVRQDVTNYTL
jgi:hypothetical protein